MPALTISAAARLCGVTRRTLQRAIQAGRLTVTTDHRVTLAALVQAGYAPTPLSQETVTTTQGHDAATTQRHPMTSPDVPLDLSQGMAPLITRLDRLILLVEALCHTLSHPPATLTQAYDAATTQAASQHPTARRGALRRQIVDLLHDHPERLSPAQIRDRLGLTQDLNNVYYAMARDGLLRRMGRGRYVGV